MTNPIQEKIREFTERLVKEDATVVFTEAVTYLEGIKDNENDPIQKELITGYIISIGLAKSMSTLTNKVIKENDEMKSQLNSQLEKIIKLEKRFDDLDAGK